MIAGQPSALQDFCKSTVHEGEVMQGLETVSEVMWLMPEINSALLTMSLDSPAAQSFASKK